MMVAPRNTALIFVHLQNAIAAEGSRYAAEVQWRGVVERIAALVHEGREAGCMIVFTRLAFDPRTRPLLQNSPLFARVQEEQMCIDGTFGAELVDGLGVVPGDSVVTHQRVSGFVASPLDLLLRDRGIESILVAGVATEVSVEGTARSAVDLGYCTAIIDDCCASGSVQTHRASLKTMSRIASVTTSEAVTAWLQSPEDRNHPTEWRNDVKVGT